MDLVKSRVELNDYLQKKDIQQLRDYHFIENKSEFLKLKKGDLIAYIPRRGGLIPVYYSTFQETDNSVIRIYCYEKRSVMYLSLETHFIYWKRRLLKVKKNDDFRELLLESLNKIK